MSSFHTDIKQDKWHQFIHLAGALGAREVRIREGMSHKKETSVHAEFSAKGVPTGGRLPQEPGPEHALEREV
tara:strand:+ start:180 stop:395 length:216 start_codon:yes stop_codon:yes gene_type:complete